MGHQRTITVTYEMIDHESSKSNYAFSAKSNFIHADKELNSIVLQQYNYDFSERIIDDIPENLKEDNEFMNVVENSIKKENGHYCMKLPLKACCKMPNNKNVAFHRLTLLKKRFENDDVLYQEYKEFMTKVIDKAYAKKVACYDVSNANEEWYLPHHPVRHPKKDKLRVVFDCAARYQGTSLNDQLLQGPNLTNTLIGTLLRFREEEIAIVGDIESMFYQVRVPETDANFLKFLV